MKLIRSEGNVFVLRVDPEEEVMATLRAFFVRRNIRGGSFSAIGGAKEVVLSWYDVRGKQFHDKRIKGMLEIANLTGNVAMLGKETIVHMHGVFADKGLHAFAGHVKKLLIATMCEVTLTAFRGPLRRALDKKTGLNILA